MEYIEFGKIVSTHGLNGEVKIYSYTNDEDRIVKLKKVYIDNVEYVIENIKQFKRMFILKVKGIDTVEATKGIMNKECKREIVPGESNEDDGYFVKDLVGMQVVDIEGNLIGTLKEVFNTGANDVYSVLQENGKEIYLPAISQVVKKIDIEAKKMIVEIMEGLISWSLR